MFRHRSYHVQPQRSVVGAVCVGLLFSFSSVSSFAQDADKSEGETFLEKATAVEDVSDLKKTTAAEKSIQAMKKARKRVLKLRQEAIESRDVVRLNCVNEKLTKVKGLLKASEQAQLDMEESLSKRLSDEAYQKYAQIVRSESVSGQLLADAEACVGELSIYTGETELTVVQDGDDGEEFGNFDDAGTGSTGGQGPTDPNDVNVDERPPDASPS